MQSFQPPPPTENPSNDVLTSFTRSDGQPLPSGHYVANGIMYLYDVIAEDAGEYACIGKDRTTGSILYTIYATVQVVGRSG